MDGEGHVAVFDSGENGAVPHSCMLFDPKLLPNNFCPAPKALDRISSIKESLDLKYSIDREDVVAWGLFKYMNYDHGVVLPYKRHAIPKRPLKIEELTLNLQLQFSKSQFKTVNFLTDAEVQPLEHTRCSTWRGNEQWLDVARERIDVFYFASEWFGIDADGNIATFLHQYAGAIPKSANGLYKYKDINSHVALWQYVQLKTLSSAQIQRVYRKNIYYHKRSHQKFIDSAQKLNLFVYEHPYWEDEIIAEPYQRVRVPATPLNINNFKPDLQALLKQVQFTTIQFAQTETLQPIEHLPCNVWDKTQAWVDSNGQDHWEM
ncbi:MAG: hypothetical protein F6J87_10925 [Spirulina sp. SIO3F2]|nr:hypothetical protein [Spirulina sp. SIO3F2]